MTNAERSARSCACLCDSDEPGVASTSLEYQLLESSKAGDLDVVRRLVSAHPHLVNCRDLDGR